MDFNAACFQPKKLRMDSKNFNEESKEEKEENLAECFFTPLKEIDEWKRKNEIVENLKKDYVLVKKFTPKRPNPKPKKDKKKKVFHEREGDWWCYDCKNCNFSFRTKCNKCKLSKEESMKKDIEAMKRIFLYYGIKEDE